VIEGAGVGSGVAGDGVCPEDVGAGVLADEQYVAQSTVPLKQVPVVGRGQHALSDSFLQAPNEPVKQSSQLSLVLQDPWHSPGSDVGVGVQPGDGYEVKDGAGEIGAAVGAGVAGEEVGEGGGE